MKLILVGSSDKIYKIRSISKQYVKNYLDELLNSRLEHVYIHKDTIHFDCYSFVEIGNKTIYLNDFFYNTDNGIKFKYEILTLNEWFERENIII